MATTLKILNADRMPNSSFKLSSVSKNTIEVNDSFTSHLNKVTNCYEVLNNSLVDIQKTIETSINANKKNFDKKQLSSFEMLNKAAKNQIRECENRKKTMKTWADNDIKDLKAAAQKKAWIAAIDSLLKETNLSAASKEALNKLKGML